MFVLLVITFFIIVSAYERFKTYKSINDSNKNISFWHKQRDEIYKMEELDFAGVVISKSSGLHRHDVDTLAVKFDKWLCSDNNFSGENYLKRNTESTLLLFVNYSAAIYPPNPIEIGDSIVKDKFSFDFFIYDTKKQLKKSLSLLFCSYENPDTIIRKDNLVFGTYGNYFKNEDTLFSGTLINTKRQGSWRYYVAHSSGYKIFEGDYKDDKRNGTFRKYYQNTNQLTYEENYQDNIPNGTFTWWYSNGKVESKRYYKKGNPSGLWEFYDDTGKLISKKLYD